MLVLQLLIVSSAAYANFNLETKNDFPPWLTAGHDECCSFISENSTENLRKCLWLGKEEKFENCSSSLLTVESPMFSCLVKNHNNLKLQCRKKLWEARFAKCCPKSQVFSVALQKCVDGAFNWNKIKWHYFENSDAEGPFYFEKSQVKSFSRLLSSDDCRDHGMK